MGNGGIGFAAGVMVGSGQPGFGENGGGVGMTAESLVRSCGVDCTSTSPNYSLVQAYLHYLRHRCGREIHPTHSVGWGGEQPSDL